jgi:hypothetical protein
MLFQRINRTDAEKIFIICQNVSGSTMTAGYSAVFDVGASVDGVRVTQASSTDLQAFAGVADEDVANNAYGKFQVYGYRSSAYIYSSAGDSVAGDILQTTASQWGLTPAATSASAKAFGFLCEAVSSSSGSSQYHLTAKIFIRAL